MVGRACPDSRCLMPIELHVGTTDGQAGSSTVSM
jgi:hypothetical protein